MGNLRCHSPGAARAARPTFEMLLALRLLEGMALGGVPAIAIAYLNEEGMRRWPQAATLPARRWAAWPAG